LDGELKQQQEVVESKPAEDGMELDAEDAEAALRMKEIQADIERREQRMDNFLNDPERSVKIFFSSYYKDKGLFW